MKKKSGLIRSITYATFSLEQSFGIMLLIAIGYAIFFGRNKGLSYQNILEQFFSFFFMVNACMLLAMQLINQISFITVSISFGITRRKTWAGVNWFNILWLLQSAVICIGYTILMKDNPIILIPNFVFLYIGVLILIIGMGMIISTVHMRFSSWISGVVSIILIIASILIVVGMGIGFPLLIESKVFDWNIFDFTSGYRVMAVIGTALIIYLIADCFYLQGLKKYEIKA